MKTNALVATVLAAAAIGCTPKVEQGDQKLKAALTHVGYTVTVKNEDSQDWNNVRVEINDKYKCPSLHISAAASERFRMTSCVAADGTAFDPLVMAPVKFTVTAALTRDSGERSNLFAD